VRSYLAIRGGVTLDANPASTSVNYDYLASDGTTIWPGTSNPGYQPYHHDVAGIGRDDASALDQRKSQSINPGSYVAIDNNGAFAADKSFETWAATMAQRPLAQPIHHQLTPPAPFFRLGRVWYLVETGAVGAVKVIVPAHADHLLCERKPGFPKRFGQPKWRSSRWRWQCNCNL